MTTRLRDTLRIGMLAACVSVIAGFGLAPDIARAAPAVGTVDLLTTPPELTSSVAPNLVLTFDDSGSMGRNYMGDFRPYHPAGTNVGWGATDEQNVTSSAAYPVGGSPYLCAGLIDPRVTDESDPRGWAMNGAYYNPNAKYRPPLLADGLTEMPNASFSAAWDNGILFNRPTAPTASAVRNLGFTLLPINTRFCGKPAGYFRLVTGVALPLDANGQLTATGRTNLYTVANWEWVDLPASEQQNFANWYSYYHTRHLASRTAISRAFAPFDENIRVAWQNINTNQINTATDIFKFRDLPINTNVRTRFYNWLFSSGVGSGTPNQAAANRVGDMYKRNTGADDGNPYWDRDINRELSCRQNFHIQMTDGYWNGGTISTATNDRSPLPRTLPDGRSYSAGDAQSSVFWNELGPNNRSMADIAFHYWATDLRPDFALAASTRLKVPPFLPDRSTSVFGIPLIAGTEPRDNKEIFWNPANDPATWPHLVQFMIGFGVSGTLPDSAAGLTQLRKGLVQWPLTLDGTDDARKIDDMWHAAINSRGTFFAASNPEQLITALSNIISSIIARRGASTAISVSLPLITDGTTGYAAGYDTTDWSGYVTRNTLDPVTAESVGIEWDAACKLTGGACPSTASAGGPARDPDSRVILTSNGTPGTGKPFRWSNLTPAQRNRLNVDPATIRLDLFPQQWTVDAYGDERVDYIRGVRTRETTLNPRFRARGSVLGAIVKGEPVYVSSPNSGHRDIFPAASPELVAANAGDSYAKFQFDNKARAPTVYVAANDGMLHAFNAQTGDERWAYVPNIVIDNFRLNRTTQADGGLVPTVDDPPQQLDVFINGGWKTVLVGSLRLGGRGIYALDVTSPDGVTEATAGSVPMWEFSNVAPAVGAGTDCQPGARYCSDMGYSYDSVQIARLKYDNRWVVLASSGYFPIDSLDPSSRELAAGRTSLLVIDLATGQLIRKIDTSTAAQTRPSGFRTFGLSTPVVYDFGSDQVDDIAVAGDLGGNVWRFDLSNVDPNLWVVDLMFADYGSGGAASVGDQPISFNPTAMSDPVTRGPIYLFGTGKFIGLPDRTSLIPEQAFYGVRDYGTGAAEYPIRVSQLITQTMTQNAAGVRSIVTENAVPAANRGWRIRLNIAAEPGERAQRRAVPFYTANLALLYTLIPKGEDPCDPGSRYGLMLVDAGTGSVRRNPLLPGPGGIAGAVIGSGRPPGNPISTVGGSNVRIPDLPSTLSPLVRAALQETLDTQGADPVWNRGAWRELLEIR